MNRLRSILLVLPVALSAQVSTFPPASASPGGDAVTGASNLTTPGGVPFVNTSGVLNIDATKLFWNNTTKRLGIGTASPTVELDVSGAARVTGRITGNLDLFLSNAIHAVVLSPRLDVLRYAAAGYGNVADAGFLGASFALTDGTTSGGTVATIRARIKHVSNEMIGVYDGTGSNIGDWLVKRIKLSTASGAACDASGRFTFEATAGGAGVADTVKVCTKDASDVYSMVPIGGGTTIDASQIVSGSIAKARQNVQTVYADQNITYSSASDQDMRLGNLRVPSGLFSAIPTASLYSGGYYVITDGNGVNCTAGGGSTATACFSNGTSWVLISGTNATANPTVTFTSQTSVTFTHNLSTDTPIIQCYDASGSRLWIEPSQITSTSTSVSTITFAASQSGKCVANATGGGGGAGGGSGDVTDVIAGTGIAVSSPGGPQPTVSLNINGGVTQTCSAGNHISALTGAGIATCTADAGGGGSGDVTDVLAGQGITVTNGTGPQPSVAVATATVPTYLLATGTLDFGSIAANACSELTFTLTGAGTQDAIAPGWPPDLDAGLIGNMYVSATNTVTVRLCKITSGSVDPASKNYRATIVRSF